MYTLLAPPQAAPTFRHILSVTFFGAIDLEVFWKGPNPDFQLRRLTLQASRMVRTLKTVRGMCPGLQMIGIQTSMVPCGFTSTSGLKIWFKRSEIGIL